MLHVRPGEAGRLVWLGVIGIAYAAATSLGDSIAQSVFVTRVGAESLPRMFLVKGALDVLARVIHQQSCLVHGQRCYLVGCHFVRSISPEPK